jgi:predicted RNA-binding protein with TRAM domain
MIDQVHCLFSAEVEQRDGSYVVEIPNRELQLGSIDDGETYRVALLPEPTDGASGRAATEPAPEPKPDSGPPDPPVTEGEQRAVEIETLGDQGDGIARVERGYVVIVPETEKGERVRIEITDVQQNVAFAEVVERLNYYE